MIPRLRFAHLPTPVVQLPRLSTELGGLRLSLKRDELTGWGLGGATVRGLEYALAEVQSNGARTLVSGGRAGSAHPVATAAAARRFGLGCWLALSEVESRPESLERLLGAKIFACEAGEETARAETLFGEAWGAGRRPYRVPTGGQGALWAVGMAQGFSEWLDQEEPAEWVLVVSPNPAYQAGLLVGQRRSGWGGRVLGVCPEEAKSGWSEEVARLRAEAADLLGETPAEGGQGIELETAETEAGFEARRLFAEKEGLLIPAQTAHALVTLARQGRFPAGAAVLLWNVL